MNATPMVAYSTRNLRADLRDRMRALAALRVHECREMEEVLNEALAIGLAVLEKEHALAARFARRTP